MVAPWRVAASLEEEVWLDVSAMLVEWFGFVVVATFEGIVLCQTEECWMANFGC